jgi:hypothetical protein
MRSDLSAVTRRANANRHLTISPNIVARFYFLSPFKLTWSGGTARLRDWREADARRVCQVPQAGFGRDGSIRDGRKANNRQFSLSRPVHRSGKIGVRDPNLGVKKRSNNKRGNDTSGG